MIAKEYSDKVIFKKIIKAKISTPVERICGKVF